ncbi:TIGR01906 family membrane protein [Vagococcus vulneris]|nr:TIGR01906 family membrane protein [Vagococcus vulneris]
MYKVKQNLSILFIFLFVISLSVAITINSKWLFYFDIDYLNITDKVDLTRADIVKNYRVLLDYLNLFWHKQLVLPDFSSSISGIRHFRDVKMLFQLDYIILLLTIVPGIYSLVKMYRANTLWLIMTPIKYFFIILGGLIFGLIIGFDTFFNLFHELLFTNNDWLFDPVKDPIIWILPPEFFMHCFILFFILLLVFTISIYIIAKYQFKNIIK